LAGSVANRFPASAIGALLTSRKNIARPHIATPGEVIMNAEFSGRQRERFMKRTFTKAAVAAALALTALSVHAACMDPRTPTAQSSFDQMLQKTAGAGVSSNAKFGEDIVGTWHVTYASGGTAYAEAFIQWHSDGTEWENINFPILGGNICMGSWKFVDRTHVSRYHVGWLYTDGTLSGHFIETETDEVAPDGDSYSGTNDTKFYALGSDVPFMEVPGTAEATRISP
jgi:uncharacterized membrane protein